MSIGLAPSLDPKSGRGPECYPSRAVGHARRREWCTRRSINDDIRPCLEGGARWLTSHPTKLSPERREPSTATRRLCHPPALSRCTGCSADLAWDSLILVEKIF